MIKLFKFIVIAALIAMSLLSAHSVAAPKPAITISPFLREVRFSANDATKDFEVTITNNSLGVQNFKLSVLDFGSLNESGGVVFAGSNASKLIKKYGLANWLQLSMNEVNIEPGKTARITVTIINDVTLQPGGHYAAIVAALDNPDPAHINEISINQKLSSLILATKVGGEKYDLKLQKIEAKSSLFRLPKMFTLHFNNPGNVHVVPRGTVKLVSPSGRVIFQGIINEDSSFVLPETTRQLSVNMRSMGLRSLWPTLYRVQVDYRYDGIEQFAHKNQTLYFVNFPGLVGLVVIISGLCWAGWKLRHTIKTVPKAMTIRVKKMVKKKSA